MYWSRRFARATNCPEALASALGRQLALPVHADWIYRQRSTPTQNNLGPRARFRNVRGAFSTRKQLSLNGLRALVVDDVLTTGATASEVAKTLKSAGADYVAVAVVAQRKGRIECRVWGAVGPFCRNGLALTVSASQVRLGKPDLLPPSPCGLPLVPDNESHDGLARFET